MRAARPAEERPPPERTLSLFSLLSCISLPHHTSSHLHPIKTVHAQDAANSAPPPPPGLPHTSSHLHPITSVHAQDAAHSAHHDGAVGAA